MAGSAASPGGGSAPLGRVGGWCVRIELESGIEGFARPAPGVRFATPARARGSCSGGAWLVTDVIDLAN